MRWQFPLSPLEGHHENPIVLTFAPKDPWGTKAVTGATASKTKPAFLSNIMGEQIASD